MFILKRSILVKLPFYLSFMINMIDLQNDDLKIIKKYVYDPHSFEIKDYVLEEEGKQYNACSFRLNGLFIKCRNAKITPKKTGLFVTLWKRIEKGPTMPFDISDTIDFIIINTRRDHFFGQFVFPKSILSEKEIITNNNKEGKRGIRVYPPWEKVTSKQAIRTQEWQLKYFLTIDIEKGIDIHRLRLLYKKTGTIF